MVALAAAAFIPAAWFVPLPPTQPLPPPPISGHALVRICLLIDGLVLLWLAVRERRPPRPTLRFRRSPGEGGWLLVAITLLALVLRLIALNSDLWLDELTPIRAYRDASAWQVAITYRSSNNHLLNTLLVKAAIAIFGEHEWAIRLPAVLWGTATIPALYWVAREALSRHASLCAAGLLAVSYHHIFFSQNARGYSAYLFLSLVSSVLLVRGLATDSPRAWVQYVVTSVINFSVLLISGFVFAAHIIVGAIATLTRLRVAGARTVPPRRLLQVFGITAFVGFQLYAAALPQMYVLMRVVYSEATSGYSPFSMELVREVTRGLGAGFGPGLLLGAIPLVALAIVGYVILVKRHWILALALTLPLVLQAAVLLAQGLTFSPRFFILALPLAILVAVQAIVAAAEAAARMLKRDAGFARWVSTAVTVLLGAASIAALPRYYQVPKQGYRAALAYVNEAHQPKGIVIEIHYAEAGLDYYRRLTGLEGSPDYFQARTVEALDSILGAHPGRPVWLVTTFPRALRMAVPDLDARIMRDWEVDRTFKGTIGDGDIFVWKERPR